MSNRLTHKDIVFWGFFTLICKDVNISLEGVRDTEIRREGAGQTETKGKKFQMQRRQQKKKRNENRDVLRKVVSRKKNKNQNAERNDINEKKKHQRSMHDYTISPKINREVWFLLYILIFFFFLWVKVIQEGDSLVIKS